jgi:hypothetical protein
MAYVAAFLSFLSGVSVLGLLGGFIALMIGLGPTGGFLFGFLLSPLAIIAPSSILSNHYASRGDLF